MAGSTIDTFPADLFDRLDNSADEEFYRSPRFVAHIDAATIGKLTNYYSEVLFAGADVLDLMSSWISHLPDEPQLGRVVGLGMNAAELAANERLNEYLVRDLNVEPALPYADESFDFVLIAVSIQYLTRPMDVFRELARVLRRGGRVLISCSHRCFPTKAIRAFHQATLDERVGLISEYIRQAAGFGAAVFLDRSPSHADPLWLICATKK